MPNTLGKKNTHTKLYKKNSKKKSINKSKLAGGAKSRTARKSKRSSKKIVRRSKRTSKKVIRKSQRGGGTAVFKVGTELYKIEHTATTLHSAKLWDRLVDEKLAKGQIKSTPQLRQKVIYIRNNILDKASPIRGHLERCEKTPMTIDKPIMDLLLDLQTIGVKVLGKEPDNQCIVKVDELKDPSLILAIQQAVTAESSA